MVHRPISARRRSLDRVALRHQSSDTGNEFTTVFHRVCERVIAADEQAGGPKIVVINGVSQIPPDLVVKSQLIDIAELILW
jgi:hypothetical protein